MGANQTKIGCIPNGWKIKNIQNLSKVAVSNGLYKSQEFYGKGPFMIHMTEVFANNVITDQQMPRVELSDKESAKYLLEDGDLVFARRSLKPEGAGDVSIVYPASDMSFESSIIRVRLNKEAHPEFVYNYLKSPFGKAQMMTLVRQVAVSGITGDDLKRYQIPVPPKPEQQKIAQILSVWDKAIEKLEALIAAKQKRKKALMQQLLTGKKRFVGFEAEWKTYHLVELFNERNETGYVDLNLLSITREKGVIPRNEVERKDTSNDDKSKYLRICPGDIGYNTMRMWQGVSALSTLEGIISPAYTVCIPTSKIDGKFASYLFKSTPIVHLFQRYSQGLTSDTWNLKFHHFGEIKVSIPEDLKEQQKISAVLSATDTEIEAHQKQLAALKEQKKGLMQQLLTGKKRVQVGDIA
jgi:type I restriction enzyme S subunit